MCRLFNNLSQIISVHQITHFIIYIIIQHVTVEIFRYNYNVIGLQLDRKNVELWK